VVAFAAVLIAAQAHAQAIEPRRYQMSILATTDGISNATVDTPIYTIGTFRTDAQPNVRSVVWLPPDADLSVLDIEWARIVAVYVDEPYRLLINQVSSCNPTQSPAITARAAALENLAANVRARAPKARFWVNFSREEVELIMNGCPFNRPYIDVVSLDIYHRLFDDVSVYYEYLIDHPATPYQQLAFIPGTFTDQQQNAVRAKTFLADFLFAADLYNAHCDLPLGPTGVTGMYDGCRVWMVAGWIGGVQSPGDAPGIHPIDHPDSRILFDYWQAQAAIPRINPSGGKKALQLLQSLWNSH
jgi:hypothetical protein